jgi:hypothetical protein
MRMKRSLCLLSFATSLRIGRCSYEPNSWDLPPPPPPMRSYPPNELNNGDVSSQPWIDDTYEQQRHSLPVHPEDTKDWGESRQSQSEMIYERDRYTPIDYQFRAKDLTNRADFSRRRQQILEDENVPETITTSADSEVSDIANPDGPKFATPRQDAFSRYMSTWRGRLILRSSSFVVGWIVGNYVNQSLFRIRHFPLIIAMIFWILTYLRNPYGELVKALGLTVISVAQRTIPIRSRYPTWPHVRASVGLGPRRPFPRNQDFQKSREISYLYTLIAMALVGSAAGGNLPLIPTWMGALMGAAVLVTGCTLRSARGDLCRSMGMRLVAVVEELTDINSELRVIPKAGVVAGKILDKILILDRKHSIKDRIAQGLTFLFDQVANATGRMDRRRDDSDREESKRRDLQDSDQRSQKSRPPYNPRYDKDERDTRPRDTFDTRPLRRPHPDSNRQNLYDDRRSYPEAPRNREPNSDRRRRGPSNLNSPPQQNNRYESFAHEQQRPPESNPKVRETDEFFNTR